MSDRTLREPMLAMLAQDIEATAREYLFASWSRDEFLGFCRAVQTAERQRCAQIARDEPENWQLASDEAKWAAHEIAEAIEGEP